jgi:hypothetical protein
MGEPHMKVKTKDAASWLNPLYASFLKTWPPLADVRALSRLAGELVPSAVATLDEVIMPPEIISSGEKT